MAHCRPVNTWPDFSLSPLSDLELQIHHNRLPEVKAFQVRLKSRSRCIVPRFPHRLMERQPKWDSPRWLEDRSMSDMTTLPAPDLGLKETAPAAWENEQAGVPGTPYPTPWANSGKPEIRNGRALRLGSDQ